VARVLEEWSAMSRIFHRSTRPTLDELDLSRTLDLAAAALGDGDEPILRSPNVRLDPISSTASGPRRTIKI
jgi:hypothetical protein